MINDARLIKFDSIQSNIDRTKMCICTKLVLFTNVVRPFLEKNC